MRLGAVVGICHVKMKDIKEGRAGSYGAWKRNTLQSAVLR